MLGGGRPLSRAVAVIGAKEETIPFWCPRVSRRKNHRSTLLSRAFRPLPLPVAPSPVLLHVRASEHWPFPRCGRVIAACGCVLVRLRCKRAERARISGKKNLLCCVFFFSSAFCTSQLGTTVVPGRSAAQRSRQLCRRPPRRRRGANARGRRRTAPLRDARRGQLCGVSTGRPPAPLAPRQKRQTRPDVRVASHHCPHSWPRRRALPAAPRRCPRRSP